MTTDLAEARSRLVAVDKRARALYDALDPLARRYEFERAPTAQETSGAPLVLILGNHSSGKSTFINFLLGQDVQKTGLAPIDDGFTIIASGAADEKDGAAVVSNPQLPYGDLERFGPGLVSHLKMKYRPSPILQGLSLVDSPGMIDAADGNVGRGYDFIGVSRWFAERADVVLLLFDPDKPGTTGETLKVLTSALEGLDHKLLIVMNKVDRFHDIRDFARTYGALCWNLSKCIPRKDLPQIYNTYVPVPDRDEPAKNGLPLGSFDEAREEVIKEVRRAPTRRVDNIVSRLYDHARRLRVHVTVCDQARREVLGVALRFGAIGVALLIFAVLLVWFLLSVAHASGEAIAIVIVGALVLEAAIWAIAYLERKNRARELVDGVDGVFARAFDRELALGDRADDLRALWKSVRDRTQRALSTVGVTHVTRLKRSESKKLDQAIEKEIPALRSEASS
ncbi:MAG TPA: dynamin family protein [Planctomycetota bacterium]|nr:dynamin family protein [Planctomycetota bacterium]